MLLPRVLSVRHLAPVAPHGAHPAASLHGWHSANRGGMGGSGRARSSPTLKNPRAELRFALRGSAVAPGALFLATWHAQLCPLLAQHWARTNYLFNEIEQEYEGSQKQTLGNADIADMSDRLALDPGDDEDDDCQQLFRAIEGAYRRSQDKVM
ncbi:hypothetical protein CAOG_009767 [Capsaspora owczarzaki ATCC 30864]|uniref:Uncharacterized protein n=1 Tax=Capsaspora owczarzaki (strain ATCC 30864) TaxID=595528 RepID=A0A0D2WQ18_CAPO3|nr:hypothetical protein CAOG_009767 [Capsaspora owczarzaki ATCC 30864]